MTTPWKFFRVLKCIIFNVNEKGKRRTRLYFIIFLSTLVVGMIAAWGISNVVFSRMGTSFKIGLDPHPGLGEVIYVMPVGVIEITTLDSLGDFLSLEYGHPVEIMPMERIPEVVEGRDDQLEADALRNWIKHKKGLPENTFRLVVLTNEDIYSPGYNFVFGQADMGGLVMLISLNRIKPLADGGHPDLSKERKNEDLFNERLRKLIRHELGHTFGLPHCRDKNCVMCFHESLDALDSGGQYYCAHCRQMISERNAALDLFRGQSPSSK